MKIELDTEATAAYKITAYSDDGFNLKDKRINANLVIARDYFIEHWFKESITNLAPHHLAEFIARQPEILLLGTGRQQVFPKQEVIAAVTGQHIGFEIMDTGAACRSYNLLVDEGRDVIACLLLPRD